MDDKKLLPIVDVESARKMSIDYTAYEEKGEIKEYLFKTIKKLEIENPFVLDYLAKETRLTEEGKRTKIIIPVFIMYELLRYSGEKPLPKISKGTVDSMNLEIDRKREEMFESVNKRMSTNNPQLFKGLDGLIEHSRNPEKHRERLYYVYMLLERQAEADELKRDIGFSE